MSTQNVNVARFARNVEWDFFCDFQTLWARAKPIDFSSLCCFVIRNNFWQKNVENLINVQFFLSFSLQSSSETFIKRRSNMDLRKADWGTFFSYIPDDDWLLWLSAFTYFLSVGTIYFDHQICKKSAETLLKTASFRLTCKPYFFMVEIIFFILFLLLNSNF